jgi:DNA-binding NtrC family response regulator
MVLLVDDEPLLLRALQRILRPEGYRVVTATCPEEMRPALDDPALDVILLDLFLGKSNGLDVLDQVKSSRPAVEVIVMTGHGSVGAPLAACAAGPSTTWRSPSATLTGFAPRSTRPSSGVNW